MRVGFKRILAAGAVTVLAATAQAEIWDMPTGYPADNFHTRNIERFAAEVRKITDGALDIVVHPDGALMPLAEIAGAVESSEMLLGEILLSSLAADDPVFGFDSLPFLATGYDGAAALWEAAGSIIEARLAERGLTLLYSVPWPPQAIFSSVEINTLEDVAGLRIRTYNDITRRMVELAGGVAVDIAAADLGDALAAGEVDAIITSSTTGAEEEVWTTFSYFYDLEALLPRNVVIANRAAFEALDAATRDGIMLAAAEAERRGIAMSAEENARSLAILEENGVQIIGPDEDIVAQLALLGDAMTAEWVEATGAAGAAIIEVFQASSASWDIYFFADATTLTEPELQVIRESYTAEQLEALRQQLERLQGLGAPDPETIIGVDPETGVVYYLPATE